MAIEHELEQLVAKYGINPLGFFWVLHDSTNDNLDFRKQNERWAFVKAESWHSLDLIAYVLWAISDNGHLLWWNQRQLIVMLPRDKKFCSISIAPPQFLCQLISGRRFEFFPDDL